MIFMSIFLDKIHIKIHLWELLDDQIIKLGNDLVEDLYLLTKDSYHRVIAISI